MLTRHLVYIVLCNPQIHKKVDKAEDDQEPKEAIKPTSINVLRDPTGLPIHCGHSHNDRHKKTA